MTDRYNYFVVGLEKDTRDDDAEEIITALKMIKGVVTVEPHVALSSDTRLAEARARQQLVRQLWDVLNDTEV